MMEEWKLRLLEETQLEAEKLQKLQIFMTGKIFPTLSRIEKDLLYDQVIAMNRFVQVLGKRLEYYNIKFTHKEE